MPGRSYLHQRASRPRSSAQTKATSDACPPCCGRAMPIHGTSIFACTAIVSRRNCPNEGQAGGARVRFNRCSGERAGDHDVRRRLGVRNIRNSGGGCIDGGGERRPRPTSVMCEERRDEHPDVCGGAFRMLGGACHRARIRATRWLAMRGEKLKARFTWSRDGDDALGDGSRAVITNSFFGVGLIG